VVNAHRVTSMADTDTDAIKSKRRQKFTRIAAMRIIFTRIGCTLLMCDMYMRDVRNIHDLVLSSLKMEGIRLLFLLCVSVQ
jgi:hypothetical protein